MEYNCVVIVKLIMSLINILKSPLQSKNDHLLQNFTLLPFITLKKCWHLFLIFLGVIYMSIDQKE